MSEYKENTVGWWLSQLKEPLKSRALAVAIGFLHEDCPSLKEAIIYIQEGGAYRITEEDYWRGVLGGVSQYAISPDFCSKMYLDGYYAAIGWSPKPKDGGEDKAIVDSPEPEVFGEKIPLGGFEGFNKWMEAHGQPNLSSEEILNLNAKPIEIRNWLDRFRQDGLIVDPPAREIEAPEPAVVGYEAPLPVDTIEKKHELRIQNLEIEEYHQGKKIENLKARVEQLEGIVGKLERQIEYIKMKIPKSK